MSTRIRFDVAYDGTAFRGWAKQPGLRTVQGVLEQAIARIVGGEVQLVVAGRTDAGVHATGQVAHVDLDDAQLARVSTSRSRSRTQEPAGLRGASARESAPVQEFGHLAQRINGIVGRESDAVVLAASLAPAGFDARFSPLWRRYDYRIADDLTPPNPLRRHDTTRVLGQLDVDAMANLGAALVGLQDFATFCKPRPEATTIRTLLSFAWQRDSDGVVVASIAADAFCHSMVRALVGASVAVGLGKLDTARVLALREAAERTSEFRVLAATGLTLVEVAYPPDDELATRADQTRARRTTEHIAAVR